MLNNPAIDVVIGLFFIYALYSLFATTITEMIATLLSLRGKVLRDGIMRMLDNDNSYVENADTSSKNSQFPRNLSPTFFNKSSFKYLGRKNYFGKYKNPSYLSAKTFSRTLLETLDIVYSKKADLGTLLEKLDHNNETHKFLLNLIEQADNNIDHFKQLTEEWYDETMNRVAGWYKRRIQRITFGIGILIAFGFNINTIDISSVLSDNTDARTEMVAAASDYMQSYQTVNNPKDSVQLKVVNDKVNALLDKSDEVTSILKISYPWCCDDPNRSSWWSYIVGCVITAIALSLGAPFWFDLLNKLVKLRSSGTQEKAKEIQSSPKTPVG